MESRRVLYKQIKNIACSYGYKLVCVDDKTYLGKNFINSMIEKSKCCSDVMKKHSNKEIVMTKEDTEDFKNSTKY